MKKFLFYLLIFIMIFSFYGCSKDPNAETYNQACSLFVGGKYAEAKAIYISLGDYNNCAVMVEKCTQKEIESQLQGCWRVAMSDIETNLVIEFENGKFATYLKNNEDDKLIESEFDFLNNSGIYWIDFDTQTIYFCSDKTDEEVVNFNMDVENVNKNFSIGTIVGYTKYCSYSYEGEELILHTLDQTSDLKYIKQS